MRNCPAWLVNLLVFPAFLAGGRRVVSLTSAWLQLTRGALLIACLWRRWDGRRWALIIAAALFETTAVISREWHRLLQYQGIF